MDAAPHQPSLATNHKRFGCPCMWTYRVRGLSLRISGAFPSPVAFARTLVVVVMPRVEVKVIDNPKGQSDWVDGAGCHHRGIPVLKLRVGFECKVVGKVVVHPHAGGV